MSKEKLQIHSPSIDYVTDAPSGGTTRSFRFPGRLYEALSDMAYEKRCTCSDIVWSAVLHAIRCDMEAPTENVIAAFKEYGIYYGDVHEEMKRKGAVK